MLAYILAITVAIGSFSFYMAAFFVPEMHRRQDFFWSGLGLFYAVVLWFCAGRLTGAVLLGQLVSVALLGGLGWHTLVLRRDLTPELVQTKVAWEDLQKLAQDLQRLVRQYGRLDDIANLGQAAWGAVSQIVANWRDRAAATPATEAVSEVPPLKRSPAYEFETAPGDGQAVPTEFATVASRQLQQQESSGTLESSEIVHLEEAAVDAIADATGTPPAAKEAASPATPDVTAAPRDPTDEATTPPSAPASPRPAQKAPTAPTPSTIPLSPAPPQASAQQSQETTRKTGPVAAGTNWVGNILGGWRKPKPQRGVIEIPPRPPSIPQDAAATPTQSQASTSIPKKSRSSKAPRAVIDIPPRPPSIPRSPATAANQIAPDAAPSSQPNPEDVTNWVDVGDASPTAANSPTETQFPGIGTAATRPTPAPVDAVNWPEEETNWPTTEAETTTRALSQKRDTAAELDDDTNWPDDEDTNWPD